jgi:hypothetical protein
MNFWCSNIRKNFTDFDPKYKLFIFLIEKYRHFYQFFILIYAIAALSQHSAFSNKSAASGHCFNASSNFAHSSLISFPGKRNAIVTPL